MNIKCFKKEMYELCMIYLRECPNLVFKIN